MEKIVKGEGGWDTKVNANFDELQKDYADVSGETTAWSDWTTAGMMLLNGAKKYDAGGNYPAYRTRTVGGNKEVQFYAELTNISKNEKTIPYIQFPKGVVSGMKYFATLPITGHNVVNWQLTGSSLRVHHFFKTPTATDWIPVVGILTVEK